MNRVWPRWVGILLLVILTETGLAWSQEILGSGEVPAPAQVSITLPAGFQGQAWKSPTAPCLEPSRLPGLGDYDGPLKKTVGLFARALERKSIHPPQYKSGVTLCSLTFAGRFSLFVDDSTDPVTFISAAIDAGFDHASNRDFGLGQGALGYSKRFGLAVADRVTAKFLMDFAYPAIFSEDPRYYRLGSGTVHRRVFHAAEHLFVAHRPDGRRMFNYSQWLGTGSSVVLSDVYHSGNDRGAGAVAVQMGSQFAIDFGFDILREFWPEIACKLKLPFRPIPSQGPSSGGC